VGILQHRGVGRICLEGEVEVVKRKFKRMAPKSLSEFGCSVWHVKGADVDSRHQRGDSRSGGGGRDIIS